MDVERLLFASQKPLGSQLLHRIPLVMVLGPAGSLADSGGFQFRDDLVDVRCAAFDGMGDWTTA